MTSSGAFAFNPAFSEVVLAAYARCGLKRTSLTNEHFADAGNEGNFLLSEWSSKQPLLWESTLISQALTEGTATYSLDPKVVMLLAVYIETGSGTNTIDRILGPLSTVEYASLPNKTMEATPTSYWFNRAITPQITFWQVPDGNGPYAAKMRAVTQVEDATMPSGVTLDIPYRALDAFTAGLAHRLARIHAPALEDRRKSDAKEAWESFSAGDTENVPMYLIPALGGYSR